LFECELLNKEREFNINSIKDRRVANEQKQIRKHCKVFAKFTNEILFDKLNEVLNLLHQAD